MLKDANAPITTPPPTPFNCPSGYVAYWYACYQIVSAQVTWAEADQACRKDGAYLSSIHSEPENRAIRLYASNEAQLPLWIGFIKVNVFLVYFCFIKKQILFLNK